MDKKQKNSIIKYEGKQIAMFSNDVNDYVSLTDIYKAWNRYSKSINAWLKTKTTLEFLNAWEKKHNSDYDDTQLDYVIKLARNRNGLSAQAWIDITGAIGIFTRTGAFSGTYAHKDIAIRFASWLSPEFELYLIEEIQRLKELERKKYSYDLLSHEQILFLVRLKEVFKYVAHQEIIETAHKEVFASRSKAENPFSQFHNWRNKILGLKPSIINQRIKEYCEANNILVTSKLLRKSKREKILMLDSYESVKIAVWDFLQIQGEVNALNLANLVEAMIRTEKGEILRENKTDLFHQKQDLGEFSELQKLISKMPQVESAKKLLEYRKGLGVKKLSKHNQSLKKALDYNPKKEKPE